MKRDPIIRLFGDDELVVDLFAGGGGASVGIERATGRSPDVAINHDREAISIHRANHPGTKHYIEDVWRVDPRKVVGAKRIALMWLSPDCKHFSKAKGSKPRRDRKIRSLASVAPYWIKALGPKKCPRVIVLENVEEFQKWGPLLADGTPCPAREGLSFRRFVRQLQNLGYAVDWRELVAADYGAPTSRKRLFLIARCDGKPIVWPKSTHDQHGRYGLPRWRAAAECIDWTLACPSIFERKKELAENTQRRIARGIEKFVRRDPFIVPVMHSGDARVHGIDEPMRTLTGAHRGEFALVAPHLSPYYGGGKDRAHPLTEPMRTQTGDNRHALVAPLIARIGQTGGNGDYCNSLDQPVTTVTSKAEHLLVSPHLIRVAHGERDHNGKKRGQGEHQLAIPLPTVTGSNDFALVAPFGMKFRHDSEGMSLEKPMPTVTAGSFVTRPAGAGHALGLCVPFLKPRYGEDPDPSRNGGRGQDPRCRSVELPMPTVVPTANGGDLVATFLAKHNAGHEATGQHVVEPMPAVTGRDSKALVASSLVKLRGTCKDGQPVTKPLGTVSAQGNHFAEVRAFLMKYHRDGGQHASLTEPMPTVVAKDSLALVTVKGEQYAIVDIGMRMLQPVELFRSHDFPERYIIDRGADGEAMTKEVQVRMVGNSVPPPMAEAIIRAQFDLVEVEADLFAGPKAGMVLA